MHKFLTLCSVLVATTASLFASPVRDDLAGRSVFDTDSGSGIVEVAYLESTGEQYLLFSEAIDGIDCYILPQSNKVYNHGQSVGRSNGGSRCDGIVFVLARDRGLCVYNGSNASPVYTFDMSRDHLFHVVVHGTAVEVDGISYTMGAGWSVSLRNTPLALFGSYRTDTKVVQTQSCRIGRCALYVGDTLLYDLVPVRFDGIGYMLDTLTGELLTNQGTGSFIIGPDL